MYDYINLHPYASFKKSNFYISAPPFYMNNKSTFKDDFFFNFINKICRIKITILLDAGQHDWRRNGTEYLSNSILL